MENSREFSIKLFRALARTFFHLLTVFVKKTMFDMNIRKWAGNGGSVVPESRTVVLDVFGNEKKTGYALGWTNKATRRVARQFQTTQFSSLPRNTRRFRDEALSIERLYLLMYLLVFRNFKDDDFEISFFNNVNLDTGYQLVMIYTIDQKADGTKDIKFTIGTWTENFDSVRALSQEENISFVHCLSGFCPSPQQLEMMDYHDNLKNLVIDITPEIRRKMMNHRFEPHYQSMSQTHYEAQESEPEAGQMISLPVDEIESDFGRSFIQDMARRFREWRNSSGR